MISALFAAAVTSAALPHRPAVPIAGALVRRGAAVDGAARRRLPRTTVSAAEHDGITHRYGGIRLADALRDAGSPVGKRVRGPAARAYVLVSATDGYQAVFSLAELDTTMLRCAPLLVDEQDGAPLPKRSGRARVVAPCDRTHARWVRGVVKLTVVLAPGPRS